MKVITCKTSDNRNSRRQCPMFLLPPHLPARMSSALDGEARDCAVGTYDVYYHIPSVKSEIRTPPEEIDDQCSHI